MNFRSLRVRLCAGVAVISAVVFSVGALLIVRMVDDAATEEALNVETAFLRLLAGAFGDEVPGKLGQTGDGEPQYAVGSLDGEIVISTSEFPGTPEPLSFDAEGNITSGVDPVEGYVISRVDLNTGDSDVILTAAHPLDAVGRQVERVRRWLLAIVPALVVAATAGAWVLTGRALQPVTMLSGRASAINNTDLDEYLPVPGTDDEIAQLATTFNGLLARRSALTKLTRQFVADASHELRSPVTAIRGHLHAAGQRSDDIDVDALIADVAKQNDRLAALVTGLTELAHLDDNPHPPRTESVDLDDLVLAVVDAPPDSDSDFDLEHMSAGRVQGNRSMLESVVRNTMENAARHASSKVWVTLDDKDGTVTYIVDDDGPGIPEPDREHVFDRFVRLDNARNSGSGGVGLGLAISKAVVDGHHGSIKISDSPRGGARIRIDFPSGAED